jgi:hypothetical protein
MITEDEMKRKKELTPYEGRWEGSYTRVQLIAASRTLEMHQAHEDHSGASNQSESLFQSHFQWELHFHVAVLGMLPTAAECLTCPATV